MRVGDVEEHLGPVIADGGAQALGIVIALALELTSTARRGRDQRSPLGGLKNGGCSSYLAFRASYGASMPNAVLQQPRDRAGRCAERLVAGLSCRGTRRGRRAALGVNRADISSVAGRA